MSKRLEWADHVWRSNDLLKKALVGKLNEKRLRDLLENAGQTESRMI